METKSISRRQLLKGTGALVVGFSFWGPAGIAAAAFGQAAGQGPPATAATTMPSDAGDLDAAQLDSWLAIAAGRKSHGLHQQGGAGHRRGDRAGADGGRRTRCALSARVYGFGDTDQIGRPGRHRGQQNARARGTAIAPGRRRGRQQLLKLASARLGVPVDRLTVSDGVVSVAGNPAKKISYGDLVGGKQFDAKITRRREPAGT